MKTISLQGTGAGPNLPNLEGTVVDVLRGSMILREFPRKPETTFVKNRIESWFANVVSDFLGN